METALQNQKYPLAIRALHWLSAVVILSLIGLGWYMAGLPDDAANRMQLYTLHKSFGVLVLLLVAVRLAVRSLSKNIPPLPEALPANEKWLAKAAHVMLYVFMFAVPLVGIAMSQGAGYPVSLFGIPVPQIFPKNEVIGKTAHELHEVFAYALLALVALHALGALKHRLFDRPENDVLKRML